MEKITRNTDLYQDFKSGMTAKNLAVKYDMSNTNVRHILLRVYNKICRTQGLEPIGWTLEDINNDDRIKIDVQKSNIPPLINKKNNSNLP